MRRSLQGIAMVAACTALFVAMVGTAYASHASHSKQASLSKKGHKGKRGPQGKKGPAGAQGATGPTGPTGAAGPAGEAGTARAYARVDADGTIDAATSKGVISVTTAGSSLLCFKLGFTPKSVVATIEQYGSDHTSTSYGFIGAGLGVGSSACPAGTSAYTVTANTAGSSTRLPVFVVFN
jgi:hypothetical protein